MVETSTQTHISSNTETIFNKWEQYIGDDQKDTEAFHQIRHLVIKTYGPFGTLNSIPRVLSSRDQPMAISERRKQITLLQDGIVILKRRFSERHGIPIKDVRIYSDYKRMIEPIQYTRWVLEQKGTS